MVIIEQIKALNIKTKYTFVIIAEIKYILIMNYNQSLIMEAS